MEPSLSAKPQIVITGLGVAPVPGIAFSPRPRSSRYGMLDLDGIDDLHYAFAVRSGAPLPSPVEPLLDLLARSA